MYIEMAVLPVKTARKADYIATSNTMADLFREFGALSVTETWGVDVPDGKLTSFPMAVKLEQDETVVVSFIAYPDKATRDEVMPKVMSDPRTQALFDDMPVDGARMFFGGYDVIVQK